MTEAISAPIPLESHSPARRLPIIVIVSIAFLVLLVVAAALATWISPHDPAAISLTERLVPPAWTSDGSMTYVLGTDALGRDVLSRLIHAARASFLVGVASVVLASVLGSLIGLVSGYKRGWLDDALMTLADVQLALPGLVLALGVIAILGPSLLNLVIVIGISGWVRYARVVRGLVIKWKTEEFVAASIALGAGRWRITLRHILPNSMSAIIVLATLDLPRAIIIEASLSFLGLGIQPPVPSWGNMVSDGRGYLDSAPWIAAAPAVVLILVTLSFTFIGDYMRERFDPMLRGRGGQPQRPTRP